MALSSSPDQTVSNYVSLEIPVTVRMNVLADDAPQAREIVNALLGNGDWIDARDFGLPFAMKTEGPNV